MPHEGPHQAWLRVTPELLAFAVSAERDVLLRVDIPREDSMVVLQMTPRDARQIAEAIIAKAKEAEAKAEER
jgi:hypothetical protein